MANEMEMRTAKEMFCVLCLALDEMGWKYKKEEENLAVRFDATGNDLSTSFTFWVDADRKLFRLMGFLPFNMSEDKRVEGSIAVNLANYKFADGNFDYNIGEGKISWRMTATFRESLIGMELIRYMILCSCHTIDAYNDQFLAISEGKMTLQEFVNKHYGD